MKRMIIALVLAFTLALCACSGKGGQGARLPQSASLPTPASEPAQAAISASELVPEQDGRGDLIPDEAGESVFTLFADFSAGVPGIEPQLKELSLPPQEELPPSNALTAFFLADSLSEWTGLDFTLNDVTFGEDSITVDWAANSTLIAGLDERAQKEDFHFYDAISLNWFMMDSLALTLKYNFAVTTVYYCSDGGPVTFTNPEDMAAEGLPELAATQPYEGSAFFVSHSDS